MLQKVDEKLLRPLPPSLRELFLYAYGMAWAIGVVAILVNANMFWNNGREDLIPISIIVGLGLLLLTILLASAAVLLRFLLRKKPAVTQNDSPAL